MLGVDELLERYRNLADQCNNASGRLSLLTGQAISVYGEKDATVLDIEARRSALSAYQRVADLERSLLQINDELAPSPEDSERFLLKLSGVIASAEDNIRSLEEKLAKDGYNTAPQPGYNPLIIQGTPLLPNT